MSILFAHQDNGSLPKPALDIPRSGDTRKAVFAVHGRKAAATSRRKAFLIPLPS